MRIAILLVGVLLFGLAAVALWAYTPDEPRATIAAAHGVRDTDFREIGGISTHILDQGPRDAPVVILLHGFGSSLETWDAIAAGLEDRFRVVRFDWPGFGLTGLDPGGDYTDARSTSFLAEVMDALGIRSASVIGHSMGGKFAWMFAADHPARVDRLVLISPDGFASTGFEYGRAPDIPLLVRLLPYVLPTALVRMSLKPAFGDPSLVSDALVARYRDFMLAPGSRASMIARMRQVILQPPEPRLRRIVAPTLLIWGEKDAMIPFSNATDYRREIPRARLKALPGLGHVPQEEAPDRPLAAIRGFLTDPDAP